MADDNIRSAIRVMKQKATYWPVVDYDENGRPELGEALEIRCRWDDSHEMYLDKEGNDAVSNASVLVDRDTPPDGMLLLSALEDVPDQSDPVKSGAYAIKRFEKTPNRGGTKFVRNAIL